MKAQLLTLAFFLSVPFASRAQATGLTKDMVAGQNSKTFHWIDWLDAAPQLKDATKLITTNTGVLLYESILETLEEEDGRGVVTLALADLNGDGVFGVAVNFASRSNCGSHGCYYEVYEDAGMLSLSLNDYEIYPSRNGILTSEKRLFLLSPNTKCPYKTAADIPALFRIP